LSQSATKAPITPCWLSRGLHASLAVRDLNASIVFYEKCLGFECIFQANNLTDEVARLTNREGLACSLAQLRRPGEEVIELIEFRPVDGSRPASGDGAVPMGHLAFAVTDLDIALAALRAAGAELLGEVVLFPEGRCLYAREPGGSVIEFEEIRNEGGA
jgi:catechol 2,3-dioxygenase-like lactoylglutathione lyase family enzyme